MGGFRISTRSVVVDAFGCWNTCEDGTERRGAIPAIRACRPGVIPAGLLAGYVTGSSTPGVMSLENCVFMTEPILRVEALWRCVKTAAGPLLANRVPAAGTLAGSALACHFRKM